MSRRYASVDRSKEIKAKREVNQIFRRQNLVLNANDFDINNLLEQTKTNSLKTLNPKKFKPKKLPLINKRITSSHLGDINSKTSDLSTEMNNAFSFERDSFENNNILKTEANKDNNNNDDYYKIVINSDFRGKSSVYNSHLNSGKKVIQHKINIVNKIKEENNKIKYLPILKSERLYPKKNIDKNAINIRKAIKAIRNNHLYNKNNKNNFTTIKSIPDNIAYESKFQNIVFDANKLLNKHNFKENDLKVNDNIDGFISQNKEMCLNNLLIKLIKKENKNLKENFDIRNKEIEKFKTILSKDKNDFELYSSKQKNLYYKTSDLLNKIHNKNFTLIRIFYELKSKNKALEDEIFKMIEQIESLRVYAQFVSRVLGGNYKLFEGELIPDYENSNKPDIKELIQKVYDKYGNLLKKHKSSVTSNTYYTINIEKNKNNNDDLNSQEETIEEIETDILNDPLFMIRKYKDIEERILYFVEKGDIFTKNVNKEYEYNNQILKDLQHRIINLQKEFEYSKKNLDDFKNILSQKDFKNNENKDFFIHIKDFCKYIFESLKGEELFKKPQKNKNNNIDIFELNDEVSKCIDALIKKEREIDKYINNLETYEKSDKKLFGEIMIERRNELKFLNQNKNKENISSGDNKKIFKLYEKFNKIIVKSKKCEPPYYKIKKEVVIKEDPNEKINKENSELITYK